MAIKNIYLKEIANAMLSVSLMKNSIIVL